jgi:hypothetical protein
MATLRSAAQADMSGWEPAPSKAQAAVPQPPPDPTSSRNPNMLASMPLLASTNDALGRQFYGGASIPQYRILPVGNGVGK